MQGNLSQCYQARNRLKKETAASLKSTLQNSEAEFRNEKAETGDSRTSRTEADKCMELANPRGLTGERAQPHEELSLQEGAVRKIRIEGIQEVEELKRAQELRVDEFSVQKLKESHETIQRLTSQIQEMQHRVNCMNDSGEFQDVESNCSGKFSHVPSQ